MIYKLHIEKRIIAAPPYSRSKFGRDAEITIALHIMSKGWNVKFSKGSRGPADLYASKESEEWYIQVKASTESSKDKGHGHVKIREACLISGRLSSPGTSPTISKCKSNFIARSI